MKGKRKLFLSMLFVVAITMLFAAPTFAKPKLNKKKATISVGKNVKLKVKGTKKKPKWYSSNKNIASVSKTGVVKGLKAGKVTIKAKLRRRILKCKVTVTSPSASDERRSDSIKPDESGNTNGTTDGNTNGTTDGSTNGNTNGEESKSPKVGDPENENKLVFTFHQDGWYVARLEVQVLDKDKQDYIWIYSDSLAKGQKTTVTIDTTKYEVNRVGYQIWFFGWDNDYMNIPWANTDFATDFTLSGSGDYPEFTWK